jgi:hypothetical protein
MMRIPRRDLREEYRLKQRERLEAAPSLAKHFPNLKKLVVTLEYYEATGDTKNGEMKCKLNVEHARTVLVYACPDVECIGGDFDLTDALADAVADRRKEAIGELHCQGTRKRGGKELTSCQTLLRYKLNLDYD